jgi:AraC family transcriptional regulator of adaptative response/methylated-DNA-[protein]-cysteine methyltransferase
MPVITDPAIRAEYYRALVAKNAEYEGVFYTGVKTTGVFCRPVCPARNPKFENCTFFETAQDALLAGFRPCKRCHPLSHPNQMPEIVQQLVDAVEAEPDKKWRSDDVRALYIDPSTARRQFKKRFGMTFIEYARARRLGAAMKHIRSGASVIDAQVSAGYESGSGFRDAFTRIIGSAPSLSQTSRVLRAAWFDTELGPMIAIADEIALYLLEFVDRRGLEREIERLRQAAGTAAIIPGHTAPIRQIEAELARYFAGALRHFQTPIACLGTPFQCRVWDALQAIPYGQTRSYTQLAASLGKESAVRAVAQANGANQLALVIPCHRVIGANGDLTGYAAGTVRKGWLIQHEKASASRM